MFDEITKMIRLKKYTEATDALVLLIKSSQPEEIAYANYLLGYIYTRYDNPEENNQVAGRYLRRNLTSDYAAHLHAHDELIAGAGGGNNGRGHGAEPVKR